MLSESRSLPQVQARRIEYAVRQLGGILPGLSKVPIGFAMLAAVLLLDRFAPFLVKSRENFSFLLLMLAPYLFFILGFVAAAKLKIWYGRRFGSIAPTATVPWTAREMKFAALGGISIVLTLLIAVAVLQPSLQVSLVRLTWALCIGAATFRDWRTAPHGLFFTLFLLASGLFVPSHKVNEHLLSIGLAGFGWMVTGLCDHWLLVRFLPEPQEE